MEKKTLEQIITEEKEHRCENGEFGINACKEAIKWQIEISKKYDEVPETLFTLLEKYLKRAREDVFFNRATVLACWELINGVI